MKALFVTTHINIGGIGNYILSLAGALRERGIGCVVASSGGNLEEEFVKRGVALKMLDIDTKFEFGPMVMRSVFALARIIRDEKADIVHAHTRVSQVAAFFACRIAGIPYVTTCHGYFRTRARKILDTWGARVIAISDAVRIHLRNDLGVSESRIKLIYSGVDTRKFERTRQPDEIRAIRKSLGLKGGPVIGTIGRLSPVKGQRFLIEAMEIIIAARPDAEALIIGDGDEKAVLQSLAAKAGTDGSIHFVSSSVDTARFLSVMDVFVFPSVKEGLGIALLEALAAGRACVASNVGGIGDIIKDDVSGMLVPAGDAEAIAKAVLRLLEDADLRRRMGEAGKALVREKFSLDRMTDEVMGLYGEVVTRSKG